MSSSAFFRTLFKQSTDIRPGRRIHNDRCCRICWTSIAPEDVRRQAKIVVLTPGVYNSAVFRAQLSGPGTMGVELVEGGDLVVDSDDCVYMLSRSAACTRVDTIYRRIDDTCSWIPRRLTCRVHARHSRNHPCVACRQRRASPMRRAPESLTIKSSTPMCLTSFATISMRTPSFPNVPTWRCSEADALARSRTRPTLPDLVVKPANESGGYGMLVGPHASSRRARTSFAELKANPRNYIAQPTLALSTSPTLCDGERLEPQTPRSSPVHTARQRRHAVTAGGLTRVAMRKGSLVVNSSQGGGSKDTWIVEDAD